MRSGNLTEFVGIAGDAVDRQSALGEHLGDGGTHSGVGAGDESCAVIGERHCVLLQEEIGI